MKNQKTADKLNPFDIILKDDFIDNRNGWELSDKDTEKAEIAENGYQLENKDFGNWHHFSKIGRAHV